ncbi:uncharacterized protein LOC114544657 [Dendronephthya gigantea]|uniref:uncharacterized protein LOC114518630 n=1 Tax=Dendronephthya gigantea TaxID=151771 RepID=UPI001069FA24|nr:uncharacterized protein LOC114518630 [Dendronephthya gigantea]XP_028412355.1 uncharacterized protein LOC114535175 [Dendronephthya gigantea]XP_028412621.1 uncharacterized protein LOC114535520 [Dendronephthya gigantea]XP_028414029.1 uncharacterized protein LOC114537098 [Dendronephthya gigantea]XP_028416837.1 uncharacterized protein LOC114541046 [Dendronephthya gigantea]XP_028418517.1 uncharacterized protein LOC114543921 [Dendronephthya gigantea]XP_028419039.1 uncharacterized protein LOC11454
MSSSSSFSSVNSNTATIMPYEMEDERKESEKCDAEFDPDIPEDSQMDDNTDPEAYFDEPIADNVWLENYNRAREENNQTMAELELRWNGRKTLTSWCSCGNCSIEMLQNAKECRCCHEIEGCAKFIDDFSEESSEEQKLTCIVNHPGFPAVCLNRWSLELAADNFKTRQGHRYKQSGSKQRFLRVVAYRQFTRMVHGRLRDKRIPLPSCAYNAIRLTHKPMDGAFTGYEELETDEESE